MKKTNLIAALIAGLFFGAKAQTTVPDPYCLAAFSNPMNFNGNSDYITDVTFGTLNNLTDQTAGSYPASPAYMFYNNLAVPSFTAGTAYPLTLKFYVGGGAGYAVWIDYNHDNTFDASERVAGSASATDFLALSTSTPTVVTNQITIPTTTLTGQTRMRIRIQEDDMMPPNTLAACRAVGANDDAYYGGEAEDYLINITAGAAGISDVKANTVACAVYPNPASDYVTIGIPAQTQITTAVVTDMEGKVLQTYNAPEGNRINVHALPKGVYLLKIVLNGGQVAVKRFSKF